jgi:hypothetical protein
MTTPEQTAATERLDEAIKSSLEALGLGVGVLTDYVVICAQQRFEDDGTASTGIYHVTSGDGVPYYRLLGLLDYTRIALRGEIVDALEGE